MSDRQPTRLLRNATWRIKYRIAHWRLQRAVRRRKRATRERVRVEEKYGDMETIPPLPFTYELLRMAWMQTIRRWFP